ncbi:MAG: serine hydrolase, partial [Saprospirales bacterium]|nr:serine hydrolase [Saprospirales bacterium]
MTKSFTAMAILKLREEGKLQLTDPVTKHLPWVCGPENPDYRCPASHHSSFADDDGGFP